MSNCCAGVRLDLRARDARSSSVSGADDVAVGRLGQVRDGLRGGRAEDLADLLAAVGANDDAGRRGRTSSPGGATNSPRKRMAPWRTMYLDGSSVAVMGPRWVGLVGIVIFWPADASATSTAQSDSGFFSLTAHTSGLAPFAGQVAQDRGGPPPRTNWSGVAATSRNTVSHLSSGSVLATPILR